MDLRAHEGSVGMLNTPYVKKDTIKNYFPLPNAIFDLGLHHLEINIYAYLLLSLIHISEPTRPY